MRYSIVRQCALAALTGLVFLRAVPLAAAGETLLSAVQFRDAFIAAISKRYPDVTVTPVGDMSIETRGPGAAHGRLNTEQPYQVYLANPGDREVLIGRYVGMLELALSPKPLIAAENLSVAPAPSTLQVADAEDANGLKRPLAGDVAAYLAFTFSETSKPVTITDLRSLGLSVDQAWDRARINDEQRPPLRNGRLATKSQPDASMGANAFARLIIDPATCGRSGLGADPRVFLVLGQGAVAFGDPRSNDSMGRLWGQVHEIAQNNSVGSRTPITCTSGQWTAVAPPE